MSSGYKQIQEIFESQRKKKLLSYKDMAKKVSEGLGIKVNENMIKYALTGREPSFIERKAASAIYSEMAKILDIEIIVEEEK